MNKKGWFVSAVTVVLAFALGDALMWGGTSAIRHFIDNVAMQWLVAIALIWLVSFVLFGCTQIWAWRKKNTNVVPDEDLRMKWALRGFQNGGIVGYLAGCFAAGPVAMGFYTGQRNDPNAYSKTALASLVFAALWGPWYLQLGRTGFVLVIVFFAVFLLAGRRSLQNAN